MGAPEVSHTPGAQVTLVVVATVHHVHEPGTLGAPASHRVIEYQMPGGQILPLAAGREGVAVLPGDAREALARASEYAAYWCEPGRCEACMDAPGPCGACQGDEDAVRRFRTLHLAFGPGREGGSGE